MADRLGDLPLAVAQAGELLAGGLVLPADYLASLSREPELLLEQGESPTYQRSFVNTVQLAVAEVGKMNPAAAQLLGVCAFLPADRALLAGIRRLVDETRHGPDGIAGLPEPLGTTALSAVELFCAGKILVDHGLARIRCGTGGSSGGDAEVNGLTMHRLTAEIARVLLEADDWCTYRTAAAAVRKANGWPPDDLPAAYVGSRANTSRASVSSGLLPRDHLGLQVVHVDQGKSGQLTLGTVRPTTEGSWRLRVVGPWAGPQGSCLICVTRLASSGEGALHREMFWSGQLPLDEGRPYLLTVSPKNGQFVAQAAPMDAGANSSIADAVPWPAFAGEVPAVPERYPKAEPLDLAFLVEVGEDAPLAEWRLALIEETVRSIRDARPEAVATRLWVIGYTEHSQGFGKPFVVTEFGSAPVGELFRELAEFTPKRRTPQRQRVAALEDALRRAVRLAWRPNVRKILVVAGSRPPHPVEQQACDEGPCPRGFRWEEQLAALSRKNIKIHTVWNRPEWVQDALRGNQAERAEQAWNRLKKETGPVDVAYRETMDDLLHEEYAAEAALGLINLLDLPDVVTPRPVVPFPLVMSATDGGFEPTVTIQLSDGEVVLDLRETPKEMP